MDAERCPVCGTPGRIISGDEGTSHFAPAVTETACAIEPALSQHEYAVDYCETHDRPASECAAPAVTETFTPDYTLASLDADAVAKLRSAAPDMPGHWSSQRHRRALLEAAEDCPADPAVTETADLRAALLRIFDLAEDRPDIRTVAREALTRGAVNRSSDTKEKR